MGQWYHVLLEDMKVNPVSEKYPQRNYAIFREEGDVDESELPDVDEVTFFIGNIVSAGDLAPQSVIMAVAYLDRCRPKLLIHGANWKRVVLASLILGCKVWEEHPVFNTDFGDLFPEISGKLLGQMEKYLLQIMKFSVGLTGKEYAKYYFQLRDLSPKAVALSDTPLDEVQLQKLENVSKHAKEWAHSQGKKPKVVQSAQFSRDQAKKPGLKVQDKDANDLRKTVLAWKVTDSQ